MSYLDRTRTQACIVAHVACTPSVLTRQSMCLYAEKRVKPDMVRGGTTCNFLYSCLFAQPYAASKRWSFIKYAHLCRTVSTSYGNLHVHIKSRLTDAGKVKAILLQGKYSKLNNYLENIFPKNEIQKQKDVSNNKHCYDLKRKWNECMNISKHHTRLLA